MSSQHVLHKEHFSQFGIPISLSSDLWGNSVKQNLTGTVGCLVYLYFQMV